MDLHTASFELPRLSVATSTKVDQLVRDAERTRGLVNDGQYADQIQSFGELKDYSPLGAVIK